LLDAAARLLTARGYAALTTNHVAEAAGVAIGSLYEYFPDKEALVAEVIRRMLREIRAELAEGVGAALVRAGDDSLESALGAMLADLFRVVEKRSALVRVLGREVPFLRDLEEVDRLSDELMEIAARARPLGKRAIFSLMFLVISPSLRLARRRRTPRAPGS
jgi:AcrR family transcriptional regulator